MFFKTNTKANDNTLQGIWMNSFYNYSAFADSNISYPSFSTDYTINNGEYETAYVKGRTNVVTLPDLASNIGNIYWVKLAPTNAAATTTSA